MDLTQLNGITNKLHSDIREQGIRYNKVLGKLGRGLAQTSTSDNITNVSTVARLQADVGALHTAATNANSAGSLLTVADGGLANITEILQRMQVLASSAQSAAYSERDRLMLNLEFDVLRLEIDRVAESTKFNDIQVLVRPDTPLVPGQTLDGTPAIDVLNGGAGGDNITPLDSDDIVVAGAGDDIIFDGSSRAPGLEGRIYRSGPFGAIANLAEAEAIVASEPVYANFISSRLDYPNGGPNSQNSNINNFLGVDAGTLDAAVGGTAANQMVFVFEGFVNVPADGNYTFNVGSDDGFNLQIDGVTVNQFPNNRGFGVSNSNPFLTAGEHSIRLLFWENGGSEGLEVFSSLTGAELNNTVLTYSGAGLGDGNDTIDGGAGTDVVTFSGNQADYTINFLAPNQVQVIDNRPGSPNGTDVLTDVEFLRFADTDLQIGTYTEPDLVTTLRWQIHEDAGEEMLEYEIVDARTKSLFENVGNLSIATRTDAEHAMDALSDALVLVNKHRSYVGSLNKRSILMGDQIIHRAGHLDSARAVLGDADIAALSTELASSEVQRQSAISVLAQTNRLNAENIETLTDETLVFGERPLENGAFVEMRTVYDL